MPAVFRRPGSNGEGPVTHYLGFQGPATIFEPERVRGTAISEVKDGTSNTLAVVEARAGVPWTKPEDLDASAMSPGMGLGIRLPGMSIPAGIGGLLDGPMPGTFTALFLDGSVRILRVDMTVMLFQALITKDGGEVVSADAF